MMPSVTDTALWLSGSSELSLLVKATLIVGVALLTVHLGRRTRASARHLVIASSFVALAALPVLIASIPALAISVEVSEHPSTAPPGENQPVAVVPIVVNGSIAGPRSWNVSPADLLRGVWAAGALLFMIPIGGVLWRLSKIRRTGLPLVDRSELAQLVGERRITRTVELLEHEDAPGPMTFGVTRPVIVLPIDARQWSRDEVRRALMHELEHIERGDWLMQILARSIAALYWFHPLVWMAWRRLCLEAERSCDDAVVMREERTDYAEQLVALAGRMSASTAQPLLGMANRSDLSTRVSAVLDDTVRRGRVGLKVAAATAVVFALIVIAVAPIRAVAVLPAVGASAEPDQRSAPSGQRRSRALDTALYEAAAEGDLDGVQELLEGGANANAVIEGDGSPLMGAARSGRIEIAQLLLDRGADPNQPVAGDGSPLIVAAQNGRFDQAELLIARGADVNLAVDGDENPLMNAAENGHLAIVRLLVDKGADIHARIWTEKYDGGGEWRTALSQARKNRRMDVVKYLESLGARE